MTNSTVTDAPGQRPVGVAVLGHGTVGAEVVRIIEPPVATFLPDSPVADVERMIRGWAVRYGHYEIEGLSVWGATARILSQLGAVLAGADPATHDAEPGRTPREP